MTLSELFSPDYPHGPMGVGVLSADPGGEHQESEERVAASQQGAVPCHQGRFIVLTGHSTQGPGPSGKRAGNTSQDS